MMSFRLHTVASAPSTNKLVKQAIEDGEPEGFAVLAFRQTEGYGRQGRMWESPLGGMYVSLLLRPRVPACEFPGISLVSALAVRRALASLVDDETGDLIRIKWPNDIVVQDPSDDACARTGRPYPKLGGISHEVHAKALCVGIGVNVMRPEAEAPAGAFGLRPGGSSEGGLPGKRGGPFAGAPSRRPDGVLAEASGKNRAAYLQDVPGFDERARARHAAKESVERTARAVLRAYAELYERWTTVGVEPFMQEYNDFSALTGRQVRIADLDGSLRYEGIAGEVRPDGRLRVVTADGVADVSSGEAHLI